MKQTLAILFFALTCHVGYAYSSTNDGFVKEKRTISPFNMLEVTKGIEVFLSQGDSTTILIEASDEDILASVITEVNGETLKLDIDDRYKELKFKNSKVTIHITTPFLTHLTANNNSSIFILTDINAKNLSLTISSSAKVVFEKSLKIENDLSITTNSLGDLLVKKESSAHSAILHATSESQIAINLSIEDTIECFAIGKSKIICSGKASQGTLSSTTKAEIRMKGFEMQNANVIASSTSNIQITVKESLAATATNNSVINYWGKPKTVDKVTTLGGRIR